MILEIKEELPCLCGFLFPLRNLLLQRVGAHYDLENLLLLALLPLKLEVTLGHCVSNFQPARELLCLSIFG